MSRAKCSLLFHLQSRFRHISHRATTDVFDLEPFAHRLLLKDMGMGYRTGTRSGVVGWIWQKGDSRPFGLVAKERSIALSIGRRNMAPKKIITGSSMQLICAVIFQTP